MVLKSKKRAANKGIFFLSLGMAFFMHGIACALILSRSQEEPKIIISYVTLNTVLESMGEGPINRENKNADENRPLVKKDSIVKKQPPLKKPESSVTGSGQASHPSQNQGETGTSKENGSRFMQKYIRQIVIMVNGKKFYPKESQKMKEEGLSVILLTLDKSGKPLSVKLKTSSGYSKLDEASLKAIYSVNMFPAFPDEVLQSRMVIEIPMRYKL